MRDTTPSRTASQRRKALRKATEERRALLVPGAANALAARVIAGLGFEAVYLTGAGFTNSELGLPDLGFVTMSEIADGAMRIGDATDLPLIVDIDTGFGNALNVHRTVRTMERAGVAAIQIEDQVFPKKCGHFEGKEVIPLPEMLAKVRAAADTREDPDFLIIARTDARAVEGIDRALDRAMAMHEAGADILFVEAPVDRAEIARIAALPVPQVVNVVFGGKTPMLPKSELADMGVSIVLYANAALQATIRSVGTVLAHLRDAGSLAGAEDLLAGFEERQRLFDKSRFDAMEKAYAAE